MGFIHRVITPIAIVLACTPVARAGQAGGGQNGGRPSATTAQRPSTPTPTPPATAARPAAQRPAAPAGLPEGVTPPSGYTIGSDDVLTVVFWQDKEMSGDVVVRPDGKITLPLINDIQAAGLSPIQLRDQIEEAAAKFLREPNATVVVKQINSRKVFITGQVAKPGGYSLTAPTSVLQLIATAGGLLEYADREHIVVLRSDNGKQTSYRFNYKDVAQQKNLQQNVLLQIGDTVLVP
jgi:polysaccharide biosynthesis/export protein